MEGPGEAMTGHLRRDPTTGLSPNGWYYPVTIEQLMAAIAEDMNGGRIVLTIPLTMDLCTRIRDLEDRL